MNGTRLPSCEPEKAPLQEGEELFESAGRYHNSNADNVLRLQLEPRLTNS